MPISIQKKQKKYPKPIQHNRALSVPDKSKYNMEKSTHRMS